MKRTRGNVWTLAAVFRTTPMALAVWCALCELADARRSSVVTPTRAKLARAIGIDRQKSVSAALTLLERAGWIERVHVPVTSGGIQRATLLRIVLCRKRRSSAPYGAKRRRGRSSGPRVEGAPTPQDFPYGKEGEPTAPALSGAGAARHVPSPEHPSARIERERLAEIRAAREAKERQAERQAPERERAK
jgi:hypothetical protein